MREKFLVLSFSFALFALGFTLPCFAQDKIAAIVNDEIITQKDLNDFINILRIQLSEELKGKELESRVQSMKVDLLNKLIEDRLILQEAKKEKIAVNEAMVKSRVAEIKRRYPSEAYFTEALAKQGLVQADIEEKIGDQFMLRGIVETKVKPRVSISPNEVTDFYQKNKEKFILPQQRELTVIDFKNKIIAEEVYNALKSGQAIDELNPKYALNTDNITVAQDEQLRKDIEDRIFKLGPGEITAPVEVEQIYYIFKLNNILPPRQQNLSEVQDEIHNFLGNQKMQEELIKWINELKTRAYIKILQN